MAGKTPKTADPNKVGAVKFLGWQSRGISLACITIISGYLMQFCTDTLNMSAAVVGTIILVSKFTDGITDFIAAYVIDNTRSKMGRGRPYEFCIIGVWIATLLLFYASPEWSETVKVVWVFTMYTFIFSIFSTLLFSSHMPYMIRAFDNDQVKIAKVGSLGAMVIMLGAMVVSISFPMLMGSMAVDHNPAAWRTLITIYAVPLALIGMLRFILVKEDPSIDQTAGIDKVKAKDIVRCFMKNKYAWFHGFMLGAYNIALSISVGSFYFTHVVGDIGRLGIIQAMSVIALPVMFAFPPLMKRFSASKMVAMGTIFSVLGCLMLFFAKANMPMLVAGTILMGIGQFPIAYLQGNIIMQLADYNEYIGLPRLDCSVGIAGGALSKIGAGLGSALLGILLAAGGYVGTATTQTDGAIFSIRALYSLAPMVCYILLAAAATRMFSLDAMGGKITEALGEKRHKATTEQTTA
jgi:Na+/melibiose symporter-like transporter